MEYKSRGNTLKTIPTETGIKEKPIFGIEYNKDGTKNVIVKGLEDIYAKAQEFKEQCDVNIIMKKYLAGDEEIINKVKGMYGDFTDLPTTLVEALNTVNNAREAFAKLPLEVREAYNHDPEQFIRDMGSEKFNKLMLIEKAIEKPVEVTEEVKTNE